MADLSKMAKSLAEMKIKIQSIVTQFILRKCRGKFHVCDIDFLQKYSNKCIWKIISELHLLYLFYQLHIVFFDLDADRNVREFPENILQQSDLPVSARAVAPCRREDWKAKVTVHLHMRRHAHTRAFATYLCKMSPLISPYTEASPTRD